MFKELFNNSFRINKSLISLFEPITKFCSLLLSVVNSLSNILVNSLAIFSTNFILFKLKL